MIIPTFIVKHYKKQNLSYTFQYKIISSNLYRLTSNNIKKTKINSFMDKNTKADRDTEFCEFIFKHWKSAPENQPLPPRLHGYDYCSKKYRIRVLFFFIHK